MARRPVSFRINSIPRDGTWLADRGQVAARDELKHGSMQVMPHRPRLTPISVFGRHRRRNEEVNKRCNSPFQQCRQAY